MSISEYADIYYWVRAELKDDNDVEVSIVREVIGASVQETVEMFLKLGAFRIVVEKS